MAAAEQSVINPIVISLELFPRNQCSYSRQYSAVMHVVQHGGELWTDKRAPILLALCVCVIVTRRRFNTDFIFFRSCEYGL